MNGQGNCVFFRLYIIPGNKLTVHVSTWNKPIMGWEYLLTCWTSNSIKQKQIIYCLLTVLHEIFHLLTNYYPHSFEDSRHQEISSLHWCAGSVPAQACPARLGWWKSSFLLEEIHWSLAIKNWCPLSTQNHSYLGGTVSSNPCPLKHHWKTVQIPSFLAAVWDWCEGKPACIKDISQSPQMCIVVALSEQSIGSRGHGVTRNCIIVTPHGCGRF